MPTVKAVLFDADGVVIRAKEPFSHIYCRERNLDPETFERFFRESFQEALVGRADLKDLIMGSPEIWHWTGDPQEILNRWFMAESQTDPELLAIIETLKARHVPVYMATSQEKYRGRYLREVMFKDVFAEMFISSEIGFTKRDPRYWEQVLNRLDKMLPGVTPSEVLFFDDSPNHVYGATRAGIKAVLYQDPDQVRSELAADLQG